MAMTWKDRLNKVVLPALEEGLHIYTALGELRPGPGIDPKNISEEARAAKPAGMPDWQVYMGPKDGQPALRFLQLQHIVRNLTGSVTMLFPTRGGDPRGIHLVVPLGEGLDTPEREMLLARSFHAEFMYRPVKVIALGRHRPVSAVGKWEVCEHLLMEIYSEVGDLLWSNPYIGMTLEESLVALRKAELVRSKAVLAAPVAAPPPAVVPHAQPALGPSEPSAQVGSDKRMFVEGTIRQFVAQGMDTEDLVANLARTCGFDTKVARRLHEDWRKRNEPAAEHQEIIRRYASQFEGFYEGNDFLEAVAEASDLGMDIVRQVLSLSVPRPVVVALKTSVQPPPKALEAAADPGRVLHLQGLAEGAKKDRELSAEVVGFVTDPTELPARPAPRPQPPKPTSTGRVKSTQLRQARTASGDPLVDLAAHWIRQIHENVSEMQSAVLANLAASNKGQAAATLRALCNIPVIGKTAAGPGKQVLDHFRRTVLDPLVASRQIDGSGQGRAFTYFLVRQP